MDRMQELRRRLDELAAEFTDVLANEEQTTPMPIGVVLLTAYGDPADPEDSTWVRATASETTPDLVRIGITTYAAARAVD